MTIAIPDEFKTFVSRGVASGRFRTEEEAVCEGLNLLREREQKLEARRADIKVGLDQLDARECGILDIEDIKRRGRQLRTALRFQECSTDPKTPSGFSFGMRSHSEFSQPSSERC